MAALTINRRRFLTDTARAGAAATCAWSLANVRGASAAVPRNAGQLIAGKDPRLIVHQADPAEIETPLALLSEQRITPKELLFVRNNQSLAGASTLEPAAAAGWSIELAGLTNRTATIAVDELARMEQVECELVLQCSGNGRALFSRVAPAKGAPWQCGAMGNVVFGGVPLARLLALHKIEPQPRARFLTAEGRDGPTTEQPADFEHSIPLADALARSIVALSMSGQRLAAVHGGPVRLITPGYYATMNVKWLSRLRFEEEETANHHQRGRYRTPKVPIQPGSEFAYNLDNSDANWRMRTKSVIFAPLDGQRVAAGAVAVRGVAWNDGAAPIETVLVATSPAGPWRAAQLTKPASPYAWWHWSIALDLPRGEHQVLARAIDGLGRSQPLEAALGWNPAGYAYSAVHAVRVTVE